MLAAIGFRLVGSEEPLILVPVGVTAEVDRMGAAVGERIDGEIGYDFLRHFRLTLGYPNGLLWLMRAA